MTYAKTDGGSWGDLRKTYTVGRTKENVMKIAKNSVN